MTHDAKVTQKRRKHTPPCSYRGRFTKTAAWMRHASWFRHQRFGDGMSLNPRGLRFLVFVSNGETVIEAAISPKRFFTKSTGWERTLPSWPAHTQWPGELENAPNLHSL